MTLLLMVGLLRTRADLAGVKPGARWKRESELSWLFRTVLNQVRWVDEFSDYEREFVLQCIARARREPNLTHLIAMDLASAHVFGPIVTTNFDDLALGACWHLQNKMPMVEPHLIYDPSSSPATVTRIAPSVPVIVKAHGHHTTYGIIDADIRRQAKHLKELLDGRMDLE